MTYKDFKYRRYLAYENHPVRKNLWSTLSMVMSHLPISMENDMPERFERYVLGGVFDANLDEAMQYRNRWIRDFSEMEISSDCRMIHKMRGDCSNSCKIVYVFDKKDKKKMFAEFLRTRKILYYSGYSVPKGAEHCIKAKSIEGMIMELPIDPNEDKMMYLKKCVKEFLDRAGG